MFLLPWKKMKLVNVLCYATDATRLQGHQCYQTPQTAELPAPLDSLENAVLLYKVLVMSQGCGLSISEK